jgi:integrase
LTGGSKFLKDEGCRRTTLGGHRSMLDLHVIPHIGKVQLSKLTPEHLRTVYRAMAAKGMATSSIKTVSRKMRAMLARAVKEKRITENVAKLVAPPKGAPAKKHVVYSPEQIQKLVQVLATDRMVALWLLLVYSGARRGEMAGLQWNKVDFGTRSICISWTRTLSTSGVEEGGTKTDAGERIIRLPQVVFDVLADWKVRQTTERMALGRRWDAGDYVFTSQDGCAYWPGSISDRLYVLTKRAGMPPIRTHALRHSLITNALKSRIDTAIIAPFVGHSDPRVTATYQHVDPEMAYDHLESLFDQF